MPPSKLGGTWTKSTIYSFQGGSDGYLPTGTLTFDKSGNLYGATEYGGGLGSCNPDFYQYCGTVFELSPPRVKGGVWTEQVLYSFKGGTGDGANPNGGLIFDTAGALYGTTYFGGAQACDGSAGNGCGVIFCLKPSETNPELWLEAVLYEFKAGDNDGGGPAAGLVTDSKGNFYGTTSGGGFSGSGTIFALAPPHKIGQPWTETILWTFGGWSGSLPMTSLVFGSKGVLYGTTQGAGNYLSVTVFQLVPENGNNPAWTFSVVCDFPAGNQVSWPDGQLASDTAGNLYGTSQIFNHHNSGAVFKLRL